jgi:methionyl-tRNA formyltransferase
MKVLFIGRTEYLYNTILKIIEKHEVCGIITAPAKEEYSKNEDDFQNLANKLNCPFLKTNKLDDKAINFIRNTTPDIAISVNWVNIINKEIVDCIPKGILNAHFGDLPSYKGNAVINWALLNFEPFIAFTIHYIEPNKLDSGDIIIQQKIEISNNTTVYDIVKLAEISIPSLFFNAINIIENGNKIFIKQSSLNKPEFRCYPRLPQYSKIDWSKSAKEIDALIRASTKPYSGAYSYLQISGKIKKVFIWSSRIVCEETNDKGYPGHIIKNDKTNGESWVYTGKGILALKLVQYENENEFKPGLVWNSIRISFYIDWEEIILNLINKLEKKIV